MSYAVYITAAAEQDIINASDYIKFVLKNPEAAASLLQEAERKINSLADYPNRFQLSDDPILASWGIRFAVVKGYLAFYVISEKMKQVTVVRFLYQKSNWAAILRQGFPLV